jgi:hypothetical protein
MIKNTSAFSFVNCVSTLSNHLIETCTQTMKFSSPIVMLKRRKMLDKTTIAKSMDIKQVLLLPTLERLM